MAENKTKKEDLFSKLNSKQGFSLGIGAAILIVLVFLAFLALDGKNISISKMPTKTHRTQPPLRHKERSQM